MKQKIIIILAGLLILAATALLAGNLPLVKNVIALADSNEGETHDCYKRIAVDELMTVFYCGTCSSVKGRATTFSGKSTCVPTQNPVIQ